MMKGYAEYKNSGEAAKVNTSTWSQQKVWTCFDIKNGATPASGIASYWDGDVPWVGPVDLGKLKSNSIVRGTRNISLAGFQSCGTSIVPKGAIILSCRAPIGHIAIAENELCFNQGCKGLVPKSVVLSNFAFWLVSAIKPFLEAAGQGTTFVELSRGKLKDIELLLPPLPEQTAIAKFLDEKTARIDELVEIKCRQIALLGERKQILIQNAVTKGLNPDAPMKDSGVDWIGEIPAHWVVKSLNFIAHLKSGDTISAERFKQNGFPVFGGNGFRGFTDKFTNEGDHILIGRQGALCGNVNYASGKFFASEHAIVVYPQLPIATRWLGELIRKANFNRLSQSAAQPGISVEVVNKVKFPYAPIVEQKKIAEFINTKGQKIDAAITIKQNQITKLNEYKTTLINAAVTGKIKVA